jgi:hypothetical protein
MADCACRFSETAVPSIVAFAMLASPALPGQQRE